MKRTQQLSGVLSASRPARRRGQAMVETALAITILLLITIGILQYGIIMNATITLSQLARDGARHAGITAANGTPQEAEQEIRAYVKAACASTTISAADLTPEDQRILITYPKGRTPGAPVTVTLKYPMNKKIFVSLGFPGLSRLNGDYPVAATMVIEG